MAEHNEVGKIGEDLARGFLEKKGYKILEQNYKTRYGEIDLVAQDKNELVFVEVRTKVGERWGSPEETINRVKMQKLLGNARAYSAFKKWPGMYRIDAVCIVLNRDFLVERITHHEGIA